MSERVLKVCRLGRVNYAEGLQLQKETETAVIANLVPNTLFLLEHPHTYTLGRNAKRAGVLASDD